jgi:hypothetical protein
VLRLKALIKRLHTTQSLEWQLSSQPGISTDEKLESLIQTGDLDSVVKTFLLGNRDLFEGTDAYFSYSSLQDPTLGGTLDDLTTEIIWKLGFQVPKFPPGNSTFWRRLQKLSAHIEDKPSDSALSEDDIEQRRGLAANVFVSLEELLDVGLTFSTWALLSDPYGRPRRLRFLFNLPEARQTMKRYLDGRRTADGEVLEVLSNGRNNLYALVHGFAVLAEVIREHLARIDDLSLERSPEEMPPWAEHSSVLTFPFRHRRVILDLDTQSATEIVEALELITRVLLAGNVMGVRNRVPHGGGQFPSSNELRIALTGMEECIGKLQQTGLGMLLFNLQRFTEDRSGRKLVTLTDFAGREVLLFEPSELSGCDLPSSSETQIILSASRIRGTVEYLRFRFEEPSQFTEMWAEFPKGRSALSDDLGELLDDDEEQPMVPIDSST